MSISNLFSSPNQGTSTAVTWTADANANSPTGTVDYQIIGNICFLSISATSAPFLATANQTANVGFILPQNIRPNTVTVLGSAQILTVAALSNVAYTFIPATGRLQVPLVLNNTQQGSVYPVVIMYSLL